MLGCSLDPDAPCREFLGDCADLASQFPDLPEPFRVPADYECAAFPNENIPTDKIITSLIMTAIALPTKMIIERLFELSNEAPAPEVRPTTRRRSAAADPGWGSESCVFPEASLEPFQAQAERRSASFFAV